MHKIRIGVFEEEQKYAISLTTYLQKYGKGKWDMSAFSEEKALDAYLQEHSLDILLGTDKKILMRKKEKMQLILLWLRDEKEDLQEGSNRLYSIYRFQSAEEIGKYIAGVVRQEMKELTMEKPMIAVYSPVGRCGKTTLALDVVRKGVFGRWMYIGMEDYSSFDESDAKQRLMTDEILYYWKEKNEGKLLHLVEQTQGIVVTGNSFVDTKMIQRDDLQWFKQVLKKSDYKGAVFDIGSGIMRDLHMLKEYFGILVPYIEEDVALVKMQNFEKLLGVQGLENERDKICFLNMNKKSEVTRAIQTLFGGE